MSPSVPARDSNDLIFKNADEINDSLQETGDPPNQSRKWYDEDEDDSEDNRTETDKRPALKKRVIQSESSSSDDDGDREVDETTALSQSTFKRSYTCRICGVPRKGHVCSYVGDGSTKRPTIHPKHHNTTQGRRGSRLEYVSVMERTDYDSDSDGSMNGDSDKNRVPATEILIPAHIFLDEVHSYILHHLYQRKADETKQQRILAKKIMEVEKQTLQSWAANVSATFEELNANAYREIQRNSESKQLEQSISKERDRIMMIRSQIRCIQNDNRVITDHVVSLRNEHNRNIATSQFLSAIDELRNK
jgi:hypothetical protein